jgi:23S rRNA (cytidine2498-2'-O)-methyltransferase
MSALLLYCRPGFESECAAEIADQAGLAGGSGYVRAQADSGLVSYETATPADALRLHESLRLDELVFARQWFVVLATLADLPVTDRADPLAQALCAGGERYGDLFIETPDTDDAKALSPLCRGLAKPLRARLEQHGCWDAASPWRAHVCLESGTRARVGLARIDNSAAWPGGIIRLKFPRGAPSRSTLKLEEAFLHFMTAPQRERNLRPGLRAVDLGAAPGGWTWQLVRRHIAVTAVDNGAIEPALLDSGLVEHVRADGFRYAPRKPVDWMVCDIVEQPIRVARLAAHWLAQGWCRYTVFNLKLPMKKRYQEVQRCLELVRTTLNEAGVAFEWRCKQLYHDREEVTVFVGRTG